MGANLWGWPESVWTFTVTQMLTLTIKPSWQVERQMLFYASNLWSSTCAQAHTHSNIHTHHQKKWVKADLKRSSCWSAYRNFCWQTSQTDFLKTGAALRTKSRWLETQVGWSEHWVECFTHIPPDIREISEQLHTTNAPCILWMHVQQLNHQQLRLAWPVAPSQSAWRFVHSL